MHIAIASMAGAISEIHVEVECTFDELRQTIAAEMAVGPDVDLGLILHGLMLPQASSLPLAALGITATGAPRSGGPPQTGGHQPGTVPMTGMNSGTSPEQQHIKQLEE